MSEHTSGPWKAVNPPWNRQKSAIVIRPVEHDGGPIAFIGPERNRKEREANAVLIKTAPVLLEACEQAEHWLTELKAEHDNHQAEYIEPAEILRVLRSAIDEARGLTP